jgi:hypothetical protein
LAGSSEVLWSQRAKTKQAKREQVHLQHEWTRQARPRQLSTISVLL